MYISEICHFFKHMEEAKEKFSKIKLLCDTATAFSCSSVILKANV